MIIQGYAAHQARENLKPFSYTPNALAPNDVLINITHCGICHSDVHLIDNDWKCSSYPFIPGHEIVGMVEAVGNAVGHLKQGQRVGVGWQAGSCLNCEFCLGGHDNLCAQSKATCVGRNGGFAKGVIVDSRFAFVIPEALSSENAAPLLCAGVTVYSPLSRLAHPKMKVGVVGIGGLGHLALQFAHAMGCEVTAFSSSADKKKEAEGFGAHHFVMSSDNAHMQKAAMSQDIILSVVSADLPWPMYINALRPNGSLVILGASPSDMAVSPGALLTQQRSIVGSNTGGRGMISEMLAFAARHQVVAKTEVLPLAEVNTAIAKVRHNQARYRMVLECI